MVASKIFVYVGASASALARVVVGRDAEAFRVLADIIFIFRPASVCPVRRVDVRIGALGARELASAVIAVVVVRRAVRVSRAVREVRGVE